MSNIEKMMKVLEDPELEAGSKGAYVVLAIVLEGKGEMKDIKAHCRDHPRQLNFFVNTQLVRQGYVHRDGSEYSIT